jgi:putative transposase
MDYYQRNHPHWFPEGEVIFLTWRLYGSLPIEYSRHLCDESGTTPGKKFRLMDRRLDRALSGPVWLKRPEIAACVIGTLRKGACELGHFILHSYVVMPNHVHALLTPKTQVSRLMNGIKGVTSRAANQILRRTGKPFWQDESFDRWVRDANEFVKIKSYIERNPVAARLVARPEDWPWSSASREPRRK